MTHYTSIAEGLEKIHTESPPAEATTRMLTILAQRATPRVSEMNGSSMALLPYSLISLDIESSELLVAIAADVHRRATSGLMFGLFASLAPETLTNLCWSFATAEVPSPELFDAVAANAGQRAAYLKPMHLANLVWSRCL